MQRRRIQLYCAALIFSTAWSFASSNTTTSPRKLQVVNLLLPHPEWDQLSGPLVQLLQPLSADVVVIHDINSTSTIPTACQLAKPLRMRCDFVTPDPPSQPQRKGTALLSARPLLADGVTLLHGNDKVQPVAAGFLRLDLGGLSVDFYTASLVPGERFGSVRRHQANDLRQWMESQGSDFKLIAANFGASTPELKMLMPDMKPSREFSAAVSGSRPHGLDVLFPPMFDLMETRRLFLPSADGRSKTEAGMMVTFQLPQSASSAKGKVARTAVIPTQG